MKDAISLSEAAGSPGAETEAHGKNPQYAPAPWPASVYPIRVRVNWKVGLSEAINIRHCGQSAAGQAGWSHPDLV